MGGIPLPTVSALTRSPGASVRLRGSRGSVVGYVTLEDRPNGGLGDPQALPDGCGLELRFGSMQRQNKRPVGQTGCTSGDATHVVLLCGKSVYMPT